MDDVGLHLSARQNGGARALGRGLVRAMPVLMKILSVVGIAAMTWVGGHIIVDGLDKLGVHEPHHSFHVFAVYPWVGMLGRGNDAVAMSVLEQCRIRWGTVLAVDGERAIVRSPPLVLVDGRLTLGAEREESVRWSAGGSSLVRGLGEGDVVSMHWDWVCDVLDAGQLAALRHWSAAAGSRFVTVL